MVSVPARRRQVAYGRLAIDIDGQIRSPRVIEVLSRLASERGAPSFLRSDDGVRLAGATELDRRAEDRDRVDRARQALAGRGAAVCEACTPRPVASPPRLRQPQRAGASVSS